MLKKIIFLIIAINVLASCRVEEYNKPLDRNNLYPEIMREIINNQDLTHIHFKGKKQFRIIRVKESMAAVNTFLELGLDTIEISEVLFRSRSELDTLSYWTDVGDLSYLRYVDSDLEVSAIIKINKLVNLNLPADYEKGINYLGKLDDWYEAVGTVWALSSPFFFNFDGEEYLFCNAVMYYQHFGNKKNFNCILKVNKNQTLQLVVVKEGW